MGGLPADNLDGGLEEVFMAEIIFIGVLAWQHRTALERDIKSMSRKNKVSETGT